MAARCWAIVLYGPTCPIASLLTTHYLLRTYQAIALYGPGFCDWGVKRALKEKIKKAREYRAAPGPSIKGSSIKGSSI